MPNYHREQESYVYSCRYARVRPNAEKTRKDQKRPKKTRKDHTKITKKSHQRLAGVHAFPPKPLTTRAKNSENNVNLLSSFVQAFDWHSMWLGQSYKLLFYVFIIVYIFLFDF